MLHFECPSCKTKCETKPEYAGQQVPCPKCGASITAPGVAPAGAAVKKPTSESSGNWLMYAIVSLLGLVVIIFVIGFFVQNDMGSTTNVVMETSMGVVKIELYQDKAKNTVENFLKYVDQKHYDGTIFHRVIPDFMIQGGGFEAGNLNSEKSTFGGIKNESTNGLLNKRGTLAMARTDDPHSATAQFFINVKDNGFLDKAQAKDGWGYAVFGRVIDGMDVVDAIRMVPTRDAGRGHSNLPTKDVIIKSIRRVETQETK